MHQKNGGQSVRMGHVVTMKLKCCSIMPVPLFLMNSKMNEIHVQIRLGPFLSLLRYCKKSHEDGWADQNIVQCTVVVVVVVVVAIYTVGFANREEFDVSEFSLASSRETMRHSPK